MSVSWPGCFPAWRQIRKIGAVFLNRTGAGLCAVLLFQSLAAQAQTNFNKLIAWGQGIYCTTSAPPGNSLPYINFCYEKAYDGVEIDIEITKDNIPVVTHNVIIGTSNINASEFTFEEIQQFSLGTWQGAPVRIPSFEEALRTNGSRGPFIADMRVDKSLAWAVSNAVKQAGFDESLLAIDAYDIPSGVVFKQALPRARISFKSYYYPTNFPRATVDAVAAAGLDGIMLAMTDDGVSMQDFVDYAHCKGLRVTTFVHYSGNSLAQLQRLVDDGVDDILTTHWDFKNQINWIEPGQPPTLATSYYKTNRMMSLSWQHQRPYAHRLQWSADSAHWTNAAVLIDCTNAPLVVRCQVSATNSHRFYRLAFDP
jgi:glycerophosphoryl diester phosphodiesterase